MGMTHSSVIISGPKSFEELLEEQLKAEEERVSILYPFHP